MEASKCPKCGEEPQFIEHIEKWYCYGCNTYVEDEAEHVCASEETKEQCASEIRHELQTLETEESKLECRNCGAELEDLKDGRLFCFVCETYQDEVHGPKEEAKSVENPIEEKPTPVNEAQQLLETATPPLVAPTPEMKLEPVIEVHTPEPIVDRVEESVVKPQSEPKPEPLVETPPAVKMCPTCSQPLKWIDKYQRSYCYSCRKYASKEVKVEPAAPGKKLCPGCSGELKFVEKYSEWYCYTCKRYPLTVQKKAEEPTPQALVCPKCKGTVKWIDKYSRYYCEKCKQYAPKGFGGVPADAGEKKQCPSCDETMKFVPEYNEWYCYKCKKYSLRPSKPVLLF